MINKKKNQQGINTKTYVDRSVLTFVRLLRYHARLLVVCVDAKQTHTKKSVFVPIRAFELNVL